MEGTIFVFWNWTVALYLFIAGVSAGAMDSMLAHYTAFRKKRRDDAFTPGGLSGARPNRASIVYANLLRQAFPGLPVILGGIEASLRRISHYDFWSDSLRRSLLLDAKADLGVMGQATLSGKTAITAAVVGVILNLALFFGYHVLWPKGFDGEFEGVAAGIAVAAALALFTFKRGVMEVIAVSAVAGLLAKMVLGV